MARFAPRVPLSRHLIAGALLSSLFLFTPRADASTWQRYYQWDYNENGKCIIQSLPDSCFVVTGTTFSMGPGSPHFGNPYLMKLDPDGNMLWFRVYGTEAGESGSSLVQGPDGGFVLLGSRFYPDGTSDFYVVKTDAEGEFVWERTYGSEQWNDEGLSIAAARRDGYIIAGTSWDFHTWTPGQARIFRINTAGNVMWSVKYSEQGYSDTIWSIEELPDGGFAAGIASNNLDSLFDRHMTLLRLTSRGRIKWARTYLDNGLAGCGRARATSDGGFILGGWTVPVPGPITTDVAIVKTDDEGNQQWKFVWGGGGADLANSIQETPDHGFLACGFTGSYGSGVVDLLLLKVDSQGRPLWYRTYGGRLGDVGSWSIQLADGGAISVGEEYSWGPGSGIFVVRTDANGNTSMERTAPSQPRQVPQPRQVLLASRATPNPFLSFTSVRGRPREKFIVYDVLGRIAGRYEGSSIGGDLPAGVYVLRSESDREPAVRITKLK